MLIFFNTLNAQHAANVILSGLQIISIASQKVSKVSAHVGNHERSASGAKFENGTYLLDCPRILDMNI